MVGLILLAVLMQAGAPAAADKAAAKGVVGDWVGPTQSVVRVYECGGAVCLKIVRLPPHAYQTIDNKNPDKALRTRPLCGVNIGTGFRLVDVDHLDDGRLYDPVSGKTYKGTVTSGGSELKLHGYVGLKAFGRTETWSRIEPVKACAADAAK